MTNAAKCLICGTEFSGALPGCPKCGLNQREEKSMKQEFYSQHWNDANGNPAGGISSGLGFTVSWQNGPLKYQPDMAFKPGSLPLAKLPNGCFVETLIAAAIDRIEYYQSSRFNRQDNADAIDFLKQALHALNKRTADRENRGVEGTHIP